ncbi:MULTISPECIES: PilT/PilU family type 4a pilus ATPase [unclassified Roseofilum]|uniref:type IV pilus twitching motility protein PilT n=1 Tax=unclassified Roseofilum TaxID=2620099 RepID=UPI001B1DA370|nr:MULTISPECIES: PilT/PilU family type 4a pilus ATPase [unclassified Roseofilum]MBP0008585.1 PilT/PilU family type 4a pilus ATPase [Roseofilum sp. Belize Diploria]MBP0033814.1 PilT/PilU family type 4a pilus ATPase [Roseofilum sp. Belize BBD 4]
MTVSDADKGQNLTKKPLPPPSHAAQISKPFQPGNLIKKIVKHAHANKASDVHIRVGQVTRFRVRGKMMKLKEQNVVTPELFEQYLADILTPEQRQQFAQNKELDTAIFYEGLVRCRVNCFDSLTGGAMVLRLISLEIPTIEQLGLPEVLQNIICSQQGLILVTGPTGSGKSTTLAAMIDFLNKSEHKHIVTIEDPIEYVHPSHKCLLSQREVGLHTHDFHQALRSVLREDPDVILIGEMRDRVTVNTALQAAQTGHLVLGTLHTRNAINAINRLLNLYNAEEQPSVRIQVADCLVGVVAQLLLPTTDGRRTAAHEILVNTPAMQDYLLKGAEEEAFQLMQTGEMEGMCVMNQSLYKLILDGRITIEEAQKISADAGELDRLMRTGGYDTHQSPRDWQ